MINYLLILTSSACSVSQSALNKMASKKYGIGSLNFVFWKSAAAGLLFFCLCIGSLTLHLPTFVYGLIYGIGLLMSNVFGFLALSKGPMAITSLMCSYSIVMPCLFGVFYFKETVEWYQLVGFGVLALSMFLLRKKEKGVKIESGWGLCVAVTFFCNGISSIVQKLHQSEYPGLYCKEFSLAATFFVALILLVVYLVKKEKTTVNSVKFACPAGVLMGFANFLSLTLSATMDATVLFPLITISTIMLNCTLSRVLFKDRFSPAQIVGIILGAVSVILIK